MLQQWIKTGVLSIHRHLSAGHRPAENGQRTYTYIRRESLLPLQTTQLLQGGTTCKQLTFCGDWVHDTPTRLLLKNYNQLRRDWLQARSVAAQLSVAQLTKTNRQMRKKRLVYRFYLSKLGVKMVNTGQITVQCSKLLNCYKVCRVGFNVTLDTTGHFRMILRTIWPDQPSHSSAEGHSLVNQWLGQGPVHEKVKQRM